MALTREQFQELRNKGLSVEQIVRFESQPVKKREGDLGVGIAKSFGELGMGIGELGRGIQRGVGGVLGIPVSNDSLFDKGSEVNVSARKSLEAENTMQGVGKFVGTAAQYLVPSSKIVQGQQILKTAATALPRGLQTVGKGAARFIPEAVGTGAVTAVRSGGDMQQAKRDALLAGGLSVGFGAIGGLARASYWPELKDSVAKSLGVQGKVSGGQALKEIERKASGLGVLKKYAPDLMVKNADDAVVPFNPKEATYDTTIQAWNAAKDKIYEGYTSLARSAGQKTTVDLTPLLQNLIRTTGEPRMQAYHSAANGLFDDIVRNFPDYRNADIEGVQKFLKDMNANTLQGFFKGTADNATAEINAGTAKVARELLDDVITKSEGEGYAALRADYASLKSIEEDLVRKFRQTARRIGGGLQDYVDMFSSGEIIAGAISANPTLIATGGVKGALGQLRRILTNPERFLRRSFDLLDDTGSNAVMSRAFGRTPQQTIQQAKANTKTGNALAGNIKESIKNPSLGLSIRPVENAALLSEARKYKTPEEFVRAQGEQVFRGGNEIFDVQKIGQDGVFVTPSQFMAETFGKNVSELYISPNAKVLSYSDLPAKLKDLSWDDAAKQISEYARKNGYDVVDTLPPNIDYPRGMERHVVNPNVLTTKSQLTDIWKKAHNK